MKQITSSDAPICPYCGKKSHLADGTVIYPHRPDLAKKLFYRCTPCGAFVGCHPGTITPLGRLANAELRKAKQAAHAAFDPKWQGGDIRRQRAYAWLAEQLGIPREDCHIGLFDEALCQRVIEACR